MAAAEKDRTKSPPGWQFEEGDRPPSLDSYTRTGLVRTLVEAWAIYDREHAAHVAEERETIIAYILRRLSGDAAINGRPASNVLYDIVDAIEGGDHLVPESEAIQRWHRRLDRAEEREAIVKWLRRTDENDEHSSRSHLARLIERGEHHDLPRPK